MSFWDAYGLPVPVRKYWIKRYNKHMKEQNKDSNQPTPDKPLTEAERKKMIMQAQQMHNDPGKLARQYMQPTRNRK